MANKISKITVKDVAYNITPTTVQDIGNKQDITFKYSSGGSSNPTYLAAWNDYQLTYTDRANLKVGTADNAIKLNGMTSDSIIPALNTPRGNLGDPSVFEMACIDQEWTNKTDFMPVTNVTLEISTDNISFIGYSSSNLNTLKKRLVVSLTLNNYTPEGTVTSTFTGTTKAPTGTFIGTKHNHTATVAISGTTGAAK